MDFSTTIGLVGTYLGIVFSVAGINFALFSWMRSDMKQFESEVRSWRNDINKEMKDFHGRLCSIEKKNITDI